MVTPAPASPVLPGPLVAQGNAIIARLAQVFPSTLFHFKFLPPKIDRAKWSMLQQGNQPFIGLGWNGVVPDKGDLPFLMGQNSWTLLVAVRAQGADLVRYFGDANGPGVMGLAAVAAAVLHRAPLATGAGQVTKISNVVADEWSGDAAIAAIDLLVPVSLPLHEAIIAPDGIGWFGVLAESWAAANNDGGTAAYTSDWENPNVPN